MFHTQLRACCQPQPIRNNPVDLPQVIFECKRTSKGSSQVCFGVFPSSVFFVYKFVAVTEPNARELRQGPGHFLLKIGCSTIAQPVATGLVFG
mmetsp:Transcript_78238/g.126885  ORF Transcript_78238/g.126885 Transcript_78238/m.126885 type:complete len:93 (-) Transcript_78238:2648-2926(-)